MIVPAKTALTARLLLAGLGLVYLAAILSLWVQIDGLVGPRGILPAERFLELAREQGVSFPQLPTLSRLIGASAPALHLLCVLGALCAALLVAGRFPFPAALGAWLCYLSLYYDGQRFLSFQWDILLLESGFLGLFLYPPLARRAAGEPPRLTWWLYRLLLFKFLLSSGVVKFSSGDPTWRDLSALTHHYETTCLPVWLGWYFHHLPPWFHEFSALLMFVMELLVPFFIFGGALLRRIAAASTIALMALIGVTGNYGFFNLLTVVLCLPLVDDNLWPARFYKRLAPQALCDETPRRWPAPVLGALAAVLVSCHGVAVAEAFRAAPRWLAPAAWLYEKQAPLHLSSNYGLFAVMTTHRPEIVMEGSDDGANWRAYEFNYKPGDPLRRPGFIGLHMPRLDWLMWFAALGNPQRDWWIQFFSLRLLQGAEPVLELLEENPFPQTPPRFIRARRYEYRFTTPEERARTGAWWHREARGPYLPTLYLPPGDPNSLAVWPEG